MLSRWLRAARALAPAVAVAAGGCSLFAPSGEEYVSGSSGGPFAGSDATDEGAADGGLDAWGPKDSAAETVPDGPSADAKADALPDGGCPPGYHRCGVQCVSSNDPQTGCGSLECMPCSLPHATAQCLGGTCRVASCTGTWRDCNGQPADGCEVQSSSDPKNCGTCGNGCPPSMGTPFCNNGQCTASNCPSGTADCDGAASNGCEVATLTDTKNCGGCGIACSANNATPICQAGKCGIGACATGFGDCDGLPGNGCEVDLGTSSAHCGGCGKACTASNATGTCAAASCTLQCNAGYGNCNGSWSDGCEASTQSSVQHCGACNKPCSAGANATAACNSGTCSVSCTTGYADCDGNPSNGCEINVQTDPAHCGSCPVTCSVAHGTAGCSSGKCAVAGCDTGWGNCDSLVPNGCETDTQSATSHCGGCNKTCPSYPYSSPSCAAGTCGFTCQSGRGDCDGIPVTGCETSTSSNTLHCGSCNHNCLGGQCSVGKCQPTQIAYNSGQPKWIALDSVAVYYWVQSSGNIQRTLKSGASTSTVVANQTGVTSIATDGSYVYFARNGVLLRVPTTGGQTDTLVPSAGALKLAVDDTDVFFTTGGASGTISKASKTAIPSGAQVLASGQPNPVAISLDTNAVFWGTSDTTKAIATVSKAGGNVATMSSAALPNGLAVDAANVYWSSNAAVWSAPKALSGATQLAAASLANPVGVDAAFVYWAEWSMPTNYAISKAPIGGGAATVLSATGNKAEDMALDNDSIYFSANNYLFRLAK
jgi:hypothetical protein